MTRDSDDVTPGQSDGPPSLADDALLGAFRETDDPVLTTDEVRGSVPFGRAPTVEGLERLSAEGVVERKPVGDGSVWWLPGYTATDERRGPMPGSTHEYEGGLSRHLENAISTLSAPDEHERAAVYAVCYFLSRRGPVSSETLRREVYPDHAAGHDDAESWWRDSVRPALAALSGIEWEDDQWSLADQESA
jgi:hypothetical protein